MKVHTGYWETPAGRQDTAWVTTTFEERVGPLDLVNALGSKYLRHEATDDDTRESDRPADLPAELTQRQIMKIFRDEFRFYGSEGLGYWGEEMSTRRRENCQEWIRKVVDDAFPGLKGFER